MAPEIKILSPDDQAILHNVAPAVFDNPLTPQRVTEFLGDDRHHLVVAVDQGQMIAEMWINEVGVAPSHQGQGVGKAMVQNSCSTRSAWVAGRRGF